VDYVESFRSPVFVVPALDGFQHVGIMADPYPRFPDIHGFLDLRVEGLEGDLRGPVLNANLGVVGKVAAVVF